MVIINVQSQGLICAYLTWEHKRSHTSTCVCACMSRDKRTAYWCKKQSARARQELRRCEGNVYVSVKVGANSAVCTEEVSIGRKVSPSFHRDDNFRLYSFTSLLCPVAKHRQLIKPPVSDVYFSSSLPRSHSVTHSLARLSELSSPVAMS